MAEPYELDWYTETFGNPLGVGHVGHLSDKPAPRSKQPADTVPMGFQAPVKREKTPAEVELWYLASPYSGHPHGKEVAFRAAAANAGLLMAAGVGVFSPISHTHPVEKYSPQVRDKSHGFWMAVDRAIFDRCDGVLVLTDPGWLSSRGVTMEVGWAKERGIPIVYMTPGEIPEQLKKGN